MDIQNNGNPQISNGTKNYKKYIFGTCVLILLLGILYVFFEFSSIIGFNIFDKFTPNGISTYSDKSILISEIDPSIFSNLKEKSDSCTNKKIDYSGEGYVVLNNKTYNVMPYGVNLTPYYTNEGYSVFDYGIFFRYQRGSDSGIYFLDGKKNKMFQLSNEYNSDESTNFDTCESGDYEIVIYSDENRSMGDATYNREKKVVLFTKDGEQKIIARYVRKDLWDATTIDDGFWYANKFYFKVDHQDHQNSRDYNENSQKEFYAVEILNNEFKGDNLFYNSFKDPINNRNVTGKDYGELLKVCDELDYDSYISDCKMKTGINNLNLDSCKNLTNGRGDDCYNKMAVASKDLSLCDNIIGESQYTGNGYAMNTQFLIEECKHGCIRSDGYSWCAEKNKCLLVGKEKCEATSTVSNIQDKTVDVSTRVLQNSTSNSFGQNFIEVELLNDSGSVDSVVYLIYENNPILINELGNSRTSVGDFSSWLKLEKERYEVIKTGGEYPGSGIFRVIGSYINNNTIKVDKIIQSIQ